jgi:hypothetical protein
MFGVWCRVSGGSRRKETEAWLQDVRRGIAVFESRKEAEAEAEAEAARLSAQMNSDLSCKAKFAYEARELPPALLYTRAA